METFPKPLVPVLHPTSTMQQIPSILHRALPKVSSETACVELDSVHLVRDGVRVDDLVGGFGGREPECDDLVTQERHSWHGGPNFYDTRGRKILPTKAGKKGVSTEPSTSACLRLTACLFGSIRQEQDSRYVLPILSAVYTFWQEASFPSDFHW